MPLDPRVRRFLDALAAGKPPSALEVTVEERRAGLMEIMKFGGSETVVAAVEERALPGPAGRPLHVRVYTPVGAPERDLSPGLIYFHGGGFVAGSIATHDAIARNLASAGACRIVSVEYRLAPEDKYPAALEDAWAAVSYIGQHAADFGIDAARLGICGDSAGGTLAAATCQQAARAGGPKLALQLLICPILDYGRSSPSRRDYARGYLVDQETLEHDLLHYLPADIDSANPRVSPLRAEDLGGMPPTIIHTAEFDPVRDDGQDYCERLRRSGSAVSYTCHPGMIHLFYGLGAVVPYARTAFRQLGEGIRAAFA